MTQRQQQPVLQESSVASGTIDIGGEEHAGRLVALGRALSDPIQVQTSKATGSHEERLRAFRNVRDEIRARIEDELAKPGV